MAPPTPAFELRYFTSLASLQPALNRTPADLEEIAAECDTGASYTKYWVPIRRKERIISIPNHATDAVQKNINEFLFPGDLYLSEAVNGYVRERSIRSNAGRHVDARHLLHMDIKDFFNTITHEQVVRAMSELGLGDDAALMVSRLVMTEGSLPLGARTSPRVSNFVLRSFDDLMVAIAQREGLAFSRYADDLTFSGQVPFSIEDEVRSRLRDIGFEANEAKTKVFKTGQPMFVTGLSVGLSDFPRLRKGFKSKLRSEFYFVEKYGLEEHATAKKGEPRRVASRLMGQFNFARGIEPDFADRLAVKFPTAYRTLIPRRDEDRLVRIAEARRDFVGKVRARADPLVPFYAPTRAMS